jgi:UDP-N-acetyl-2-amino-2-deoxyglucuronate dehydrogenase
MRIGLIGTGAIAHKHAQAYQNIGFEITVCANRTEESGRKFAEQYGAKFLPSYEDVCRHPQVDVVDVCTFPDFRNQPLRICAETGKHIQVEKPIATTVRNAREMIRLAKDANILLNVISQRRFEDINIFLAKAIAAGRLGRIIQCDCYVKWYRSDQYYSRPGKGTWQTEGGGALVNQGIHQVDLARWLVGPVAEVSAEWQLGSVHNIESEDVVNAVVRFASGATGVIQASTAIWPGYTERVEIHGTLGSAIVASGKLVAWDVQNDGGDLAPMDAPAASGASDPMAVSVVPLERQFFDFANAIRSGGTPLVTGEQGLAALQIVEAVYDSCRSGKKIAIQN